MQEKPVRVRRLLVTGSRYWEDYSSIYRELKAAKKRASVDGVVLIVIEGGADGADDLARMACRKLRIPCLDVPADWDAHGKSAGPIRNRLMSVIIGRPHRCLAFHPDLSQSRGTRDMVGVMKELGVDVRHFRR